MMVGDTEVFPGQKLIEGTTIKLFLGVEEDTSMIMD